MSNRRRPSLPPVREISSLNRMWRSPKVILGTIGAVVATVCLCGTMREDRRCVDANNNVIDDINCSSGHSGARWYYGGSRGGNGKVTGGSYERGGFGRFFSGGGS